jgi:hypothetical protein
MRDNMVETPEVLHFTRRRNYKKGWMAIKNDNDRLHQGFVLETFRGALTAREFDIYDYEVCHQRLYIGGR